MATRYPNIFYMFQKELVASLYYNCVAVEGDGNIELFTIWKVGNEDAIVKVVFVKLENKACCDCLIMEHKGIVCCHILALLKFKGIIEHPEMYILPRWTCDVKKRIKVPIYDNNHKGDNAHRFVELSQMCNTLIDEAMLDTTFYDSLK